MKQSKYANMNSAVFNHCFNNPDFAIILLHFFLSFVMVMMVRL